MKKGNKVLALFLAAVMVATSVSWNFSEVKAETTEEITSQIVAKEDGVSIDFDNIDVAELDANGYVSTKFKSGEAVQGEVNQPVSKHWFSGDGNDTPYGNGGTIKSKNIGLKTKDTETDDTKTVMYTPYSYEDFQISAEIYYGAFAGIVLGEKNVYPTGVTSPSVALFFNAGRIHIVGAVERSTAKIMRGTSAAIADNGSALGYKIFNNGEGNAIAADAGGTYTVNVKKTGNHLLVWISGGAGLMSIELSDSYKTGWLGIQSKCYDGDGGGFKSLNIEKVHAVEHHELENVSLTELDDAGYSYTFSSNKILNKASDAIKSVDGILKGITTGDSMSSLNIPYIYKNFRFEAEIYPEQAFGVAMGKISSVPLAGSELVSAYFNSSQLEIRGAVTATGAKALGGGTGTVSNASMFKLDNYDAAGKKYVRNSSQLVTIVVEVKGNTATAWLEDYNGYVSLPITTSYATEKISLIGRSAGGFKSYTITNLDAGYSADFDNVNLTNLDAAGYKTRADGSSTLLTVADSKLWFSGNSTNYSGTEKYKNEGLKSNNTDSTREILNIPHTYENFRMHAEVYHGQVLGVKIGPEAKGTQVNGGTATSGSVSIYINGENLSICGAIDYATAQLDGASTSKNQAGWIQYKPVGNSARWNEARTLIIEVQNGILTVSFADLQHVFRVKLHSSYKAGSIAFFTRQYNTSGSNAGGGLKGYTIEKLPATNNINTTVDVAGYTDFDFVDTAVLDEKGFSVSKYETDGAVVATEESVATHMYAGEVGLSAGGKVAYNKEYPNSGLKAKNLVADNKMTVLNTPYTYDSFRASTEVYWGANTGILIGEENVYPTVSGKNAVRIYFNANQLQLSGGGFNWDTAKTSGGANKWNPHNLTTYELGIFKPASNFTASKGAIYKLNVEFVNGIFTIWVDGYDGVVTIKATDEFMNVENKKIALTSRGYDGDCGGLKSLMVEEISDIVIPYTAKEFATYRSAEGHTEPTYKDYLFAGWFTDEACTVENAVMPSDTTVEGRVVYARFASRDVLTVKAQISSELLDEDLTNNEKGNIRFATTVDSANYSKVGFEIAYDKDGDGEPTTKTSASKDVYSTLKAIGGVVYKPTDFCRSSVYFKACTVKNIGADYFGVEFTVTPFWTTLDGTVVKGDSVVKTVEQGINTEILNGKTALFVGDSIQNGANESVDSLADLYAWYERLSRYGMVTEEVANKGAALTNKETSGRSQIVTQLDDATKESYDFVILEGGVNDVRIDQDKQDPDITIAWGTIDEDPNKADYGDSTIAGAMQNLIKATQVKFPNAEIVYIINHHFGATETNMKNYVAMVKAACRVHNISYVDLSDTEAYPTLEPLTRQSAEYIPDNLHPNAAGYELSTPVIANHLRKLVNGEFVDNVYVSNANGKDAVGRGTADAPYKTLNYAVSRVADGGTVYVQDTIACMNPGSTSSFTLGGKGFETGANAESSTNINDKINHKQVTIAGANDAAKLDFSAGTYLFLNESVILEDIQVAWPNRIFAEGNTFIIKDTVTQVGSKTPMLMGGSSYHNLKKTDLRVYAGTYSKIVGGQQKLHVEETNVIVGGKVNNSINTGSHDHAYILLGGSYSEGAACTVSNTNVTVENGAKFNYVFGGGAKAENVGNTIACAVQGDTNVVFAGEAYGVYGGACGRLTGSVDKVVSCKNTNVKIVDGANVAQVFGGSEHAAISGNASVQLLGGKVTRRVWGGCYNEEHPATYYANGTVTVTISPAANLSSIWHGLAATSRYNVTSSSTETGVFIFNDYVNNGINIKEISTSSEGDKSYDHLVKVGANGIAKVVDGKLVVTPNSGYTATVEGATDNGDGTYIFTAAEVVVTFATEN